MTPAEFWDRVESGPQVAPGGCWIWTGAVSSTGYGTLRVDGKTKGAHRHAFELDRGRKIKKGAIIMHLCDNRQCVNPSHLEEGTTRANARDRADKHRDGRSRKRPIGRRYW